MTKWANQQWSEPAPSRTFTGRLDGLVKVRADRDMLHTSSTVESLWTDTLGSRGFSCVFSVRPSTEDEDKAPRRTHTWLPFHHFIKQNSGYFLNDLETLGQWSTNPQSWINNLGHAQKLLITDTETCFYYCSNHGSMKDTFQLNLDAWWNWSR